MIFSHLCQRVFCLCFPLTVLQFLALYWSLIHFEFILVYGVRKYPSFIFYMYLSVFTAHLLKRLSFLHCIFLPPLLNTKCPQLHGFISRIPTLCHWSIFLLWCQCHIILMAVTLQYSLKSGRLILPVLLFFLKIGLAIMFCFYVLSFMFP